MNNLILMIVIIQSSVLIAPSHLTFAYSDPKLCNIYNVYFDIGYRDGYSDAQNGISPAYACVDHSRGWCDGYNAGFRAGNGGNNIYYGADARQSPSVDVHGDNNKISINQQSSSQVRDNKEFPGSHKEGALPSCLVLCLNSDIRIR